MKINCKINFFFPKDFKPLSESTTVEIPLSINNTQLNQPHHFLHKQANNQWVTSPNFKVPHFLKLEQHKSQSNQPNTNVPLKLTVKKKKKKDSYRQIPRPFRLCTQKIKKHPSWYIPAKISHTPISQINQKKPTFCQLSFYFSPMNNSQTH